MTAPTRVPCSYPECGGGCAGCQPEPQQTPRPSWVDGGAGLHSTEGATSDAVDAARWRRLVNASELPFPVAAIADDPENDKLMVYGRKRLEQFIDSLDEISDGCPPAPNQGEAS